MPVGGQRSATGRRPGKAYQPRPRPRWGRIALLAGIAVLVIGLIAGISLYGYAIEPRRQELKRTDAFSALTGDRPASRSTGAQNILLVGSDSRDPDANDGAGQRLAGGHADPHARARPTTRRPSSSRSRGTCGWSCRRATARPCGDGSRAKINASFAFGGLPRAVHTVECLTDVHVDNVMAIDFGGFKEVTDAIGGVDLYVDQTITSIHKPHRVFTKGMMHMNGDQALDWVRQRKQFARGDFARMQHQQEFLKALMDKASSSGALTNPSKLNNFLKAVTAAVTVDKDFSLTDMAVQFRGLRGNNLTFITMPQQGQRDDRRPVGGGLRQGRRRSPCSRRCDRTTR